MFPVRKKQKGFYYEQEKEINGWHPVSHDAFHRRSADDRNRKCGHKSKGTGQGDRHLLQENRQHQGYRKMEEAEEEYLRLCGVCEGGIQQVEADKEAGKEERVLYLYYISGKQVPGEGSCV